jgi:hypothetical protein
MKFLSDVLGLLLRAVRFLERLLSDLHDRCERRSRPPKYVDMWGHACKHGGDGKREKDQPEQLQ